MNLEIIEKEIFAIYPRLDFGNHDMNFMWPSNQTPDYGNSFRKDDTSFEDVIKKAKNCGAKIIISTNTMYYIKGERFSWHFCHELLENCTNPTSGKTAYLLN